MARDFISEILELNKINVHIKNPKIVNEKLNGIIRDGFNKLQVVSDFDMTITKQHENGKQHMSSFRMFSHCPSLSEDYLHTNKSLALHYRPFEYDPEIPLDEKTKLMEEWWSKSEEALKGLTVSQEEIDRVVSELSTSLREGSRQLFEALHKRNVPVLVFSAGLGDTVVSVLKHYKVLLPNVKVISNFLKYDDSGTILGFSGPVIHILNKNEYAIKDSEFYDLMKDRDNVILMGDSLGDGCMADGISHANHVLKIGFIYEKVEGNLPVYMDTFDIVLEDDQTMAVPAAIIKRMED